MGKKSVGDDERIAVDADGVFYLPRVAAGEHDRRRYVALPGRAEDQLVSRLESRKGQRKPTQLVFLVRVGAGDKEEQVGFEPFESRRQPLL